MPTPAPYNPSVSLTESRDAESIDLRSYLRVLARRKVSLGLVTLGLVATTVIASLLPTPIYESTAEILLQPRGADYLFDSSGGSRLNASRTVETEIRVMKSDPVRQLVREKLGSAPSVSASRVGETEVMEIRASSESGPQAAEISNAYATSYVEFRRRQATDDSLAAATAIQRQIDELRSEIDAVDRQIAASSSADRAATEARLRPRYTSLLTQEGVLSQKLNQLQVSAALNTGGAQVVRAADVPTSPARPKPVRNALAALAAGLVAGVGFAFLREHLDDSIENKDELSRALGPVPVLAAIPVNDEPEIGAAAWTGQGLRRAQSSAAEAYRTLRTSVQLLGVERPLCTIQVTSPLAGDGKTTTLANLALVLAMAGQRVVMVDGDLRRPRLHRMFDVHNDDGFTSLMLGSVSLQEAVKRVPGPDPLFLLTSGPPPANPSELLSLSRTSELIFELQNSFDIVLIDSAPVLPVTDATVLAAWVDATLLVTNAGSTTRKQVADALERLRQVDAPLVGAVLNRAPTEAGYEYRYDEDGRDSRGKREGRRQRRPATLGPGASAPNGAVARKGGDAGPTDPTEVEAGRS